MEASLHYKRLVSVDPAESVDCEADVPTPSPSQNEEGFFEPTGTEEIPTVAFRNDVRIGGAKFPYTIEFPLDPERIESDAVTVIAHGFGGIELAYAGLRGELARAGHVAATYDPPRSRGLLADLNPLNYRDVTKLNSQAVWGVMKDINAQFGWDIFDILGHSLGGKSASDAANHRPDYVRNLILHGSVGASKHHLPEMLHRAGQVLVNEIPEAGQHLVREHGLVVVKDALRYFWRNPPRFVAEGVTAAESDILESVEVAKQRGIKTSNVIYPADGFFDPRRVKQVSGRVFHLLHEYYDLGANHVALQTDPQGVAIAHIALAHSLQNPHTELRSVA